MYFCVLCCYNSSTDGETRPPDKRMTVRPSPLLCPKEVSPYLPGKMGSEKSGKLFPKLESEKSGEPLPEVGNEKMRDGIAVPHFLS